MRVLDDQELRHSIFISHSRRDPAAINITYAIINALRYAVKDDGSPICPVTYLPGDQAQVQRPLPFVLSCCGGAHCVCRVSVAQMWLWLDKEQMADSGGSDWVQILTKAQKKTAANWFFLGNACTFPSLLWSWSAFHGASNTLKWLLQT